MHRLRGPARAGIGAILAVLAAVVAGCGGSGSGDGPAPDNQTADTRNPSVARLWNEALLDAIRKDLARPTVHARNLFHVSAAMYDAWALYSDTAQPYLAGGEAHGFACPMTGFKQRGDLQLAPRRGDQLRGLPDHPAPVRGLARRGGDAGRADALMSTLGYDASNTSTDLSDRLGGGGRQPHRGVLHRLRPAGRRQRSRRLQEPALPAGQCADRTAEARQPEHRGPRPLAADRARAVRGPGGQCLSTRTRRR